MLTGPSPSSNGWSVGEGVDGKEDGSDSLFSVGEDGGLGLGDETRDGFVPSFVDAGGLGSASGYISAGILLMEIDMQKRGWLRTSIPGTSFLSSMASQRNHQ